jgi:hypothetical protein
MHVLPRVRELEQRFPDMLTVIGVHAGKFVTERSTERIAEACDRLGVVHAVVNDRQFRVWRDYAVQAWPTVAVIDPEGYVALVQAGEFDVEAMASQIQMIADWAREHGTLVPGPDPLAVKLARHEGTLRFPTRAIIDGGRLWVSDTGHGRVLECSWDAARKVATVVAEYAGFLEPRGLAALEGRVYVADRAGHAVYRIGDGARERVAGTGRIGDGALAPGSGLETDLRSPWGLSPASDGRLAVTMAGAHQVWRLGPATGDFVLLAGAGGEGIHDGAPLRASLAQPTGTALMPANGCALADCESSAVRILDAGGVRTVVGTGLFEFGDRDGAGDRALLQHCEDVAAHEGVLAVADTYNDRLKRVDPVTRKCGPWQGEAGEKGSLREPGGVWSDWSTLLVADTGHHRIVAVETDGSLTEVRFGS